MKKKSSKNSLFKSKFKKFIDKNQKSLVFWGFLAPALFAFTMTIIIPFFLGFYYSFTNWRGFGTPDFIGFANYARLFNGTGAEGIRFLYSLTITFIFAIFNIILLNVIAFSLALLVTRGLKFQNFYRVGFFLPNLIGGIVLGYLWKFIFNSVVTDVSLFFMPEPFLMLADRDTAILAISLTWGWQYAGYLMMIYVTAIQNIPQDVVEASSIDGASAFQRIRHILLPMVAPAFTVTLFLTLINSFKQFDVNFALTAGGPSTQVGGLSIWGTKLISMYILDTYQVSLNPALAQAQAVVFFIILTIISLAQVTYNKRKEVEA